VSKRTTFQGPWADTIVDARNAALDAGGVDVGEYVVCEYSDGVKLAPVDESWPELGIEVFYSESRDQFRATVRKL
jgi:hypothetical protein